MIIYIILLFISLILLLLKDTFLYKKKIYRNIIFLMISILLFIIYIFRSETVGTDYFMYNSFFNYTQDALKFSGIESAYIHINNIAQYFNNFLIVPIVIFLLLFIGLYIFSRELNMNSFMFLSFFILTYIYYELFNVMRQFSALGIVCFGLFIYLKLYHFKYLKYVIYILLVLLATFFHNTAIFCILLIFLFKLNLNKNIVTVSVLLIPFLFVGRIIDNLSGYIALLFPYYISKYNNNGIDLFANGYKSNAQLIILISESIFFLLLLYLIDYNKLNNLKINFVLNGYFLFLILSAGSSNILIGRIVTYLYIFQFLFSYIFVDKLDNKYKIIKLIYICFLIIYYLFQLFIDAGGIIPYKFI